MLCVTTLGQFESMFLFLEAVEKEKPQDAKWKITICIIVFNSVKLVMTASLCTVSLCFASELKSQVGALVREFGNSDPHVDRLQLIYGFIMRFSIVFLVSILCINLVQPALFVTLTNYWSSSKHDSFTWSKSFSVVTMTLYQIEVNLMQLLILFFHHRLDEQQQKAKIYRNSVNSNSAYSMSSNSLHDGPQVDRITLYSSDKDESTIKENPATA